MDRIGGIWLLLRLVYEAQTVFSFFYTDMSRPARYGTHRMMAPALKTANNILNSSSLNNTIVVTNEN